MTKPTVLYICHNHPAIRPGGAEIYAHELFQHVRRSDDFDAVFLAKGGPPLGVGELGHPGTVFTTAGDKEYLFFTDGYEFDWFNHTLTDKDYYAIHVRRFLEALRPDIVHIQHTQFLGVDVLRVIRDVLPDAPILYTLHEYAAICHRQGQMLRVRNDEPCTEASPRRCHECFPDIAPPEFFLRERFIRSQLDLVDLFIAPSRFLLERYVDWGIPRDRIVFEENGRQLEPAPPAAADAERPRNRIGFFGQLSPYKGAQVLLEALVLLEEQARTARPAGSRRTADPTAPHLWIHGANLDLQAGGFRDRIADLLHATKDSVTFVGPYTRDELPALLDAVDWVVLPSIWWENSPLVIQEAFHRGRPVICSDIGGMAEKVRGGVDGLHFRAGDPRALAAVLERAVATPGLWDALREGIEPVHSLDAHRDRLFDLYRHQLHLRVPLEISR
jgi:glycosyltransferase involved in cell wall biosynthesis